MTVKNDTAYAFKLPRELLKRLHVESGKRGMTTASFIRMVLLETLERG